MKKVNNPIDIKEKIENTVVDWIASVAAGQLTVTKPVEPAEADLWVEKRGEYYDEVKIYLQIRNCDKDPEKRVYRTEIIQGDIEPNDNFYLVFLYFDIVVQDISEYVWLVPVNDFFEIADSSSIKNNKRVFKFEVPLDTETESKYTKYLIHKKELARVLEKIIKAGGKFSFPEAGFSKLTKIKLDELKGFIVEARNNTYAGEGVLVDNPRLKGSKELEYQKGDWFYRDIYFDGDKNFIGQEVVYYDTKPIWSMGYFGEQPSKEVVVFLKIALLELAEKCRFGETCELKKKELFYKDQGTGNLECFWGQETISLKGTNIYKLNYQGGLISR
ncbi:hypothetical protein KKE19_02010 [Patescibacteria group bacterium]|nr:hypothetical protein [Patescibacteria group bacterium]MBU4367472.1 hypothetical protein [Patescibacteria group bacterium]MBU4461792.1 hypothetical protein [Patescibacteria group bacterium]MCG2700176.1 DUF5680 domain-containing protein [Candidatus Parcubacteria bacterium]